MRFDRCVGVADDDCGSGQNFATFPVGSVPPGARMQRHFEGIVSTVAGGEQTDPRHYSSKSSKLLTD